MIPLGRHYLLSMNRMCIFLGEFLNEKNIYECGSPIVKKFMNGNSILDEGRGALKEEEITSIHPRLRPSTAVREVAC